MVNGTLTPSAKATHWRKAKRDYLYSIFCLPDPLPPNTRYGGRGRNPREKCMFLAFWSANWRKGVSAQRAGLPLVAISPVPLLAAPGGPLANPLFQRMGVYNSFEYSPFHLHA